MTEQTMEAEIVKLRERLDKAVVFEVGVDISIGMSMEDELWRIRKQTNEEHDYVFLNKDGIWELPPDYEDEQFAMRTGFDEMDEAFDAFDDYVDEYGDAVVDVGRDTSGFIN